MQASPRDAGAIGAAIVGFYVLDNKRESLEDIAHLQKSVKTFNPNVNNHKLYDKYYVKFKKLYKHNPKILSQLTTISEGIE